MIRAILTDIEGTTSSLSFVKDTLFPYARARMADFVRSHGGEDTVRNRLADARQAAGDPLLDEEGLAAQLVRWIDEDRKVTPLKALQGLIWEEGYRSGDFFGHVYDDAVRQLRAWHERGFRLYVFSSGSVHAQQLLFGHTRFGDLNPLFSGYFDTRIGAKQEPGAYHAIAQELALPPSEILFLSDIEGELNAAREAGFKSILLDREGASRVSDHPKSEDFDSIYPERL